MNIKTITLGSYASFSGEKRRLRKLGVKFNANMSTLTIDILILD